MSIGFRAAACLLAVLVFAAGWGPGASAEAAEAAAPERVFFLHCGGDNDKTTDSNNLYFQTVDGRTIPEVVFRAEFIPSALRDYSNEAAQERAETGMELIRRAKADGCGTIIVSAYSHGGMTAWFMDYQDVDCLVLIDAVVHIKKIGSDRDILAAWVNRLLAVGAGGTDILFFATNDKFNRTSDFVRSFVELLEASAADPDFRGENGETITAVAEDEYVIRSADGQSGAELNLIRLDSSHGKACINAAETIAGLLAMD